jgi:hypothetical protein
MSHAPEKLAASSVKPTPEIAGPAGALALGSGSERTCATCKYKMTAGSMVDPCFPCLHEHSIWTGEPKQKYDAWVDERLTWDEVNRREQEQQAAIQKAFDESPELQEMVKALFSPNDKAQTRST